MNCLLRIANVDQVEIDGYEQFSTGNEKFWVFEISQLQQGIELLLQDVENVLLKQKTELNKLSECGAKVSLFLEHEEALPIVLKKEMLSLIAEAGANLEIYYS